MLEDVAAGRSVRRRDAATLAHEADGWDVNVGCFESAS
jgi:hypothetical protein